MIHVIFFSFMVFVQVINAADGRLFVRLTDHTGVTVTTALQAREDYLQVSAHHLTMAKNALPRRIDNIMQQEDLSAVSEQELQCIQNYLEQKKSKDWQQWVKDHDCNVTCGLLSSIVGSFSLAMLGGYLCTESVGLEITEDTSRGAALAALPIAGYAGYKFAQYYQPDQSEISNKIERVSQALRNKQKQD